jgi:hypothetical protein
VKLNMHVFDVSDFNWSTCWVNTLEYVYSLSYLKKKKSARLDHEVQTSERLKSNRQFPYQLHVRSDHADSCPDGLNLN